MDERTQLLNEIDDLERKVADLAGRCSDPDVEFLQKTVKNLRRQALHLLHI